VSTSERDLIVGGQAVIEGVMMRTPNAYAVAVRRSDGTVVRTSARLPKWSDKFPVLKLPLLRGGAVLVQSVGLGVKALNYSANQAFADSQAAEAEVKPALTTAVIEGKGNFAGVTGAMPGLFPLPSQREPGGPTKRAGTVAAASSILLALVFNLLLFIALPLVLTNALFIAAGWARPAGYGSARGSERVSAGKDAGVPPAGMRALPDGEPPERMRALPARAIETVRGYLRPVRPSVGFNLIDGLIRMTFFLIMIFSFSLAKDIRRVFEYHGAEHKTVFAWEKGLPLTITSARSQPRQHPRCGTSFLMVVMLVAILLFSIIRFDSLVANFLTRVALIPVVAGVSYEIIRLSAKRETGAFFKLITRPGVWLQNITTKEPDDSQLEVAIEALRESLKLEPQPQEVAAAPLA
jgi:uncharacterized protein YqhQ